jgi:uncharacterized protein (TIGR02001 family)
MTKLRIVCAAAALAATASGNALAETTANVGYMSDYIFRGYYQAESVAFGGLDIETESGLYMGLWGANVKQGLEYDLYMGYAGGGENFQWYAGVTGYYYTDEFDDTYEEANLGFTFGFMTVDYAVGDYHIAQTASLPANADDKQTYQYLGVTFAPEVGPYYFLGRTDYKNLNTGSPKTGRIGGTAKDGFWFEIGKSFEIMEDLEFAVAALYSGDVQQYPSQSQSSIKLGPNPIVIEPGVENAEYALTFSLTKTFSINDD